MKAEKTKQKFLELRAQGKSLRAIEIEIGTSRGTLAKWEQEYREELTNLKAIELDAMREKYIADQPGAAGSPWDAVHAPEGGVGKARSLRRSYAQTL